MEKNQQIRLKREIKNWLLIKIGAQNLVIKVEIKINQQLMLYKKKKSSIRVEKKEKYSNKGQNIFKVSAIKAKIKPASYWLGRQNQQLLLNQRKKSAISAESKEKN